MKKACEEEARLAGIEIVNLDERRERIASTATLVICLALAAVYLFVFGAP